MADKTWFRINAKAGERPEIVIYDEIGLWGVTASSFHKELKGLGLKPGDEMDLRLNTPGGDVFTGNALFNMLRETGASITVYVDGVAASMGSLIAMVGEPVVMASNAMMMIHNPAAYAHGDSKAMRRMNQLLDSLKAGMVSEYAKKSGLSAEEVSDMMEDETWMTAEDAVAYGFADSIGPEKEVHAVDLSRFKSPPRVEAFVKGRKATTKESDMDKNEVASMIEAANKPILEALAKLAPPAPEAKTESAEDIAKRVNAERDAYEADITALCEDFGKPEAAATFIKDKKTVADVRAALRLDRDKRAKSGTSPAPRNHVAEDGTGGDAGGEDHSDLVVQSLDHTSIWNRYNRKAGGIQRVVPTADKAAA